MLNSWYKFLLNSAMIQTKYVATIPTNENGRVTQMVCRAI